MEKNQPGSIGEIVRVKVNGHQIRGFQEAKPYIAYVVNAGTKLKNWKVYKRFSDFVELDKTFSELFPDCKLPVKLPRKTIKWLTPFDDPKVIEEREAGLDRYLQFIITSDDARWRNTGVWRSFLLPPGGILPSYSVPKPSSDSRRSSNISQATCSRRNSADAQVALFGGWTGPLDKSLAHPPESVSLLFQESIETAKSHESKPVGDQTPEQRLQYQNEVMGLQDKTLEELATVVGRQKQLGMAIGDEIEAQNDLLLDIELKVDTTAAKMKSAGKRLDHVRAGL